MSLTYSTPATLLCYFRLYFWQAAEALDELRYGIRTRCCKVTRGWVCGPAGLAATVRSLNHLRSLATVEETINSSGERRDEMVYVRENRVTGLAIHLAIGASLLMLPMLQSVPKAVLYGLFLYMGVVSIAGNQFFQRIGLWLMDSELYPRTHYMRRVPNWTIHKFTLLQVVCLVISWVVKVSMYTILFPIFIASLVPVRAIAGRFFAPEHLEALDAEKLPTEAAPEWV